MEENNPNEVELKSHSDLSSSPTYQQQQQHQQHQQEPHEQQEKHESSSSSFLPLVGHVYSVKRLDGEWAPAELLEMRHNELNKSTLEYYVHFENCLSRYFLFLLSLVFFCF